MLFPGLEGRAPGKPIAGGGSTGSGLGASLGAALVKRSRLEEVAVGKFLVSPLANASIETIYGFRGAGCLAGRLMGPSPAFLALVGREGFAMRQHGIRLMYLLHASALITGSTILNNNDDGTYFDGRSRKDLLLLNVVHGRLSLSTTG